MLVTLCEKKRPFQLVLRTFGTDIPEVLEELCLLAGGNHPLFPQFAGSPALKPVEGSRAIGTFFRNGVSLADTHLVLGTLDQPPSPADGLAFYEDKDVDIVSGLDNIDKFFEKKGASEQVGVLALRDYYPWWAENQESDTSGKLLVVPSSKSLTSIFFDDNVEKDRAHIVDVRTGMGVSLPFEQTNGRLIIRAEPWHSITDRQWFVKALQSASLL